MPATSSSSLTGGILVDKLVLALGPAFAAGFAIQRLMELLDSFLGGSLPEANKKRVAALVSLAFACLVTFVGGLRVLLPLGMSGSNLMDGLVTMLVISAGTEGFNSIMKFLGYAKEDKKADAATKLDAATSASLATIDRMV
jgi:hypothetical protein